MAFWGALARNTGAFTKVSLISFLRFFAKHYYWFIFLLVYIPILFSSLGTAVETGDYLYPVSQLGIFIFNSDNYIDGLANELRENPEQIYGKKQDGFLNSVRYYWDVTKVWYDIFAHLVGIFIPFFVIYRIFQARGTKGGEQSSVGNNIISALWVGLIFMLIVNLVMLVIGAFTGTTGIIFPEDADTYEQISFVLIKALPFHGLANFISYLAGIPLPDYLL